MAEEKTENKEVAAGAPPAGSKLPVILGVLNLILILGIGAVVFLQFQKDKHKESVADIDPSAEHGEAGGEHGAPAGEHGAPAAEHGAPAGEHGAPAVDAHGKPIAAAKTGPQVITFEQFTVNLSTSPGTPPRFARVVIAVEVASSETAQELGTKTPQVRNAILDLFNSKRPSDLQTGEGRNFLKEEIRNALNSFLVTGKVKGVFFSNFVVGN